MKLTAKLCPAKPPTGQGKVALTIDRGGSRKTTVWFTVGMDLAFALVNELKRLNNLDAKR